jgi:hypothetical protein
MSFHNFFIWQCFLSMSGTSWLLEQPSSCRVAYCYTILKARIMTMGSSAPWVVYIVSAYRLIVYRVVTKLLLHDCKTTLVAVLLSLLYIASALPSLYKIEVLCWLSAMSNSMANMTPNFRSTGLDLTTIYYHRKFSKWNRFRLDSFRHDISPAIW